MDGMNESDCFYTPEEIPDTAPLNSQDLFSDSQAEEEHLDDSWGFLQPSSFFNFEPIVLTNPVYSFGKMPNCHIRITEEKLRDKLKLSVVSKIQFEILLQGDVAVLKDYSMNGTFVNHEHVGKGKVRRLQHRDQISIAYPNCHMYTFLDPLAKMASMYDWMPLDMRRLFTVRACLGQGAFGQVNLAQNRDGEMYAIKKLTKQGQEVERLINEVKILQRLQHPCVISMESCHETSDSLYIVMEYANGGDLAKLLNNNPRLSDFEKKSILYQLTLALQYLHNQGIAHRDLKPANILLQESRDVCDRVVKVSDFGLSKLVCSNTELHTMCGTPLYAAPEVLLMQFTSSKTYTHQVDIWSLGVVLFLCLSGKLPFSRERADGRKLVEQIATGNYVTTGSEWSGVPVSAVNLVRCMLVVNPSTRITIKGILEHPWLQDNEVINRVNRVLKSYFPLRDEVTYQDLTLLRGRGIKRGHADLSE